MQKKQPQVEKSIAFIMRNIAEGAYRAGETLPPVRMLANAADVSTCTMVKAIAELKKKGVVRGDRRAIIQGSERDASYLSNDRVDIQKLSPFSPTSWKRVHREIERDILTGRYAASSFLPSGKELCRQYRTTYRTLRKALSALLHDSIIVANKRGYAIRSMETETASARIVLMCYWGKSGAIQIGQHDRALVRELEAYASRTRWMLDTVAFGRRNGRLFFRRVDSPQPVNPGKLSALGYIVLANMNPQSLDKEVFKRLAAIQRPVAILDQIGGWSLSDYAGEAPHIRMFTLSASRTPARIVGRYLLELGHRNVAYVSPYTRYLWSRNRLAGLKEIFSEAGYSDGVKAFVAEESRESQPVKYTLEQLLPMQKQLATICPPDIREDFSNYFDRRFIQKAYGATRVRKTCRPLFENMLSDRSITALVTVNDAVALFALEFLREKNIRVPQDISVVSFDDTFEAYEQGLTSYNFNIAGAANAMVGYLLNPQAYSSPSYRNGIEIEGMVVTRNSTGRARR
jgi:DNA-binding transcriptional regulator YhcF (GntR family)